MINVGEICDRNVLCVPKDTPILMTIQLMRKWHSGSVIAVDENSMHVHEGKPLGIVSDSAIITEVYATGLDPRVITVGDLIVLGTPRLSQTDELSQAIFFMHTKGLDHLLVVDHDEYLIGTVSRKHLFDLMAKKNLQHNLRISDATNLR